MVEQSAHCQKPEAIAVRHWAKPKDNLMPSIDVPSRWWGRSYDCREELLAERQYTSMAASLNDLASVSEFRREIALLSRHTHNMKGGPLNVMEVVGRDQ